MSEVIYSHEQITLYYDAEHKIVHHEVHSPLRGRPLRDGLTKGAQALGAHGACKWLSDDRNHFVIPPEDQEWAMTHWFPTTQKLGWKYWAIVKPEKAVASLFLRRLADDFGKAGVVTKLFTEPDHGMAWLREIDAP